MSAYLENGSRSRRKRPVLLDSYLTSRQQRCLCSAFRPRAPAAAYRRLPPPTAAHRCSPPAPEHTQLSSLISIVDAAKMFTSSSYLHACLPIFKYDSVPWIVGVLWRHDVLYLQVQVVKIFFELAVHVQLYAHVIIKTSFSCLHLWNLPLFKM